MILTEELDREGRGEGKEGEGKGEKKGAKLWVLPTLHASHIQETTLTILPRFSFLSWLPPACLPARPPAHPPAHPPACLPSYLPTYQVVPTHPTTQPPTLFHVYLSLSTVGCTPIFCSSEVASASITRAPLPPWG